MHSKVAKPLFRRRSLLLAAAVVGTTVPARATITLSQVSNTDWNIGNGSLSIVFNPSSDNLTSVKIGSSANVLDPSNSEIYQEHAGTPFGAGTQTFGVQQTSNYIDVWTSTASTGTATNPITYSYHYVLFNNSPNVVCYEVLNHAAADPATSVGQGQFLARVSPSLFNNTYQFNVSVNNPGAQTSAVPPTTTAWSAAGRTVQDATTDISGIEPGDWGTQFYTKYDHSSYIQNLQASVEYGSQYSVSALFTSEDSMTGGPTKQSLMFTNTISMIEFLSGHYGGGNYSYTPVQGVDSSRLFGAYAFQFAPTNGQTGAQIYQNAVTSMPALQSLYQTDAELVASGYVPPAQRGGVQISATSSSGWSANTNNNTVVLSDPNRNFQQSTSGSQYWAQLSSAGTTSLANVAPGTYRLSMYQLGQWGETRVDGVVVQSGKTTLPKNLKFTPENFGASIWTIGTPDRSSHEFLNGSNSTYTYGVNGNVTGTPVTTNGVTPGGDLRQFYGSYNYWYEEQQLGTPGYVSYNATAIGSTPATNNPLNWIANQWGKFNPGIYNSADSTSDGYSNGLGPNGGAPAYVVAGGGPGTYGGAPWQVNFTVTPTQLSAASYKFLDLSVGLAGADASLIVTLNGHQEIWHSSNTGDPMVRSGDAGYYQFLVFEFPVADLTTAGTADQVTFSVSQTDGDMYDALRFELSTLGANPSITGWHDYEYITGSNTQTAANDSIGLAAVEDITPEPASLGILALGAVCLLRQRGTRRRGTDRNLDGD